MFGHDGLSIAKGNGPKRHLRPFPSKIGKHRQDFPFPCRHQTLRVCGGFKKGAPARKAGLRSAKCGKWL